MSLSKALIINNISNAILMTLPAIIAAAWKISTSSAHLNKNFAIRPRPHGSKQSSSGSQQSQQHLRQKIGSSRHAWMDTVGTWSKYRHSTLKPWIYSNRHFNSSWQVYTIHESSDRQLHHARITSTTLCTKHQGSLRKGTQQTNRNTSRMTRPKTFLRISTFYTPAYITKTLSSGPASSCNTDRRRINTIKMSRRRWVPKNQWSNRW